MSRNELKSLNFRFVEINSSLELILKHIIIYSLQAKFINFIGDNFNQKKVLFHHSAYKLIYLMIIINCVVNIVWKFSLFSVSQYRMK